MLVGFPCQGARIIRIGRVCVGQMLTRETPENNSRLHHGNGKLPWSYERTIREIDFKISAGNSPRLLFTMALDISRSAIDAISGNGFFPG